MEVSTRSSLESISDLDLDLTKELLEKPARHHQLSHCSRARSTKAPWRRTVLILGFCITILTMAIISFLSVKTYTSLRTSSFTRPTGHEFGNCGTSISSARSKGCIFDNMSFHWVRPACFYSSLLSDFRNRTSMPYYSNTSLHEDYRIPTEEIEKGDHLSAWAPASHHPVHCAYLAQMVHLALVEHRPIDSRARDYGHGKHCGKILLDGWLHEMPECKGGCISGVNAQFTSCGYV